MAGASFSLSSAVLMSRLLFNQPPSVSTPLSLLSARLSDQCHSSPLTAPLSMASLATAGASPYYLFPCVRKGCNNFSPRIQATGRSPSAHSLGLATCMASGDGTTAEVIQAEMQRKALAHWGLPSPAPLDRVTARRRRLGQLAGGCVASCQVIPVT